MAAGKHSLRVVYDADSNFTTYLNNFTVNVAKITPIMNITDNTTKYLENAEFTIKTNVPGYYTLIINGTIVDIYKIDNGHANYGFEYINTTNTTKSWGSTEWEAKVTDKGKISWTDGAFKVAKENNAYSYVEVPGDKNVYTIEEFQKMFIMN